MIECPKCGNSNIVNSHKRGMEKLYSVFFPMAHYRCKECWHRFWKFERPFKSPGFLMALALFLIIIGAIIYTALFAQKRPPLTWPDTRTSERDVTEAINRMQQLAAKDRIPEPDYEPMAEGPKNGVDMTETSPKETPGDTPPEDTKAKATKTAEALPTVKKPSVAETRPPKEVPAEKQVAKKTPPKKREATGALRKLTGMESAVAKGWIKVKIIANGPVAKFKYFSMASDTPPKIVVDLPGRWKNRSGKNRWSFKSDLLKQVRIGEHPEKLRLVFDLKQGGVSSPKISKTQSGCEISLRK